MSVTVEPISAESLATQVVPVAGLTDNCIENSRPNTYRFLALVAQLAMLMAVLQVYRVEQFNGADQAFLGMCYLAFGAFVIHYWLPFAWKERFWVAVSILSMPLFMAWKTGLLLIVVGAVFYAIVASPLSFRKRIILAAAGVAVIAAGMVVRRYTEWMVHISPSNFFPGYRPLLGSLFVFRTVLYLYDLRHLRSRPLLTHFLAYFFILPNYVFLLFPVIDYSTMRLGYYRRDIHTVAQQGIRWIVRGTIQLLLYMIVFFVRDVIEIEGVHSLGKLVSMMFLTFLLYLRVSGQFHIIVGILHLFGYDLPETNNKYLLSSSLTDFWRRINIYWKDFMVKVVYFPTYFRLRKKGELRAQMIATTMVFVVTWALHSLQAYWLKGSFVLSLPDLLFWGILGALVILNVWWEMRHPRRRRNYKSATAHLRNAPSVLATLAIILVLWSLWNAPSLGAWIDLLTWWKPAA